MDAVEVSGYAGLVAIGLLTLNILLGLLISVRYNTLKKWPNKKLNLLALHNWTGYLALIVAVFHPLILVFSKTAGFGIFDIVFPVSSPSQPLENSIGAIALYLLLVVIVTSYFKRRLRFKTWKKLHYLAYVSAGAFYTHGILTDPNLKNTPLDVFDAEKLYVEFCALIVLCAIAMRLRYQLAPTARAGANKIS